MSVEIVETGAGRAFAFVILKTRPTRRKRWKGPRERI